MFFRKIPSTDLCCPIFGSCCSYYCTFGGFLVHDDDNNNNNNNMSNYCCCYCCCCGCIKTNIHQKPHGQQHGQQHIERGDKNNGYRMSDHSRTYNVSISISDTRSLPDISYYKSSPPAPVIQKLIQQQQQQIIDPNIVENENINTNAKNNSI